MMQIYAIRLCNFMRFGNKNNSLVFDIAPEDQELIDSGKLTLDALYDRISKDPLSHIKSVKARGITNLMGIAGIIGDNYDESNGVGKSSILEAICYVHYEKIVRRNVNTDKRAAAGVSVVTRINGKFPKGLRESYVEEFFEEGGKIYRAKRGRVLSANQKDHSAVMELECFNEDKVDHLSGHRKPDSSEFLASITPMDYDLFCSSVMFGQSDAGKFLIGTDKTRKEMVISLLKLEDTVSGYLKYVREKKNKKETELTALNAKVEVMLNNIKSREPIEVIEAKIKVLKDSIKNIDEEIKLHNEAIEKLSKSESIKAIERIKEEGKAVKEQLNSQKEQKETQIKQWKMLGEEANKKESNVQNKISLITTKQKEISRTIEAINAKICKFDLKSREELLAKVEKAKKAQPQYIEKVKTFQDNKERIVADIATESAENKRIMGEQALLKEQLKNAGDKSEFICDKCKSKVSKQHIESEIQKFEDLIRDRNINITKLIASKEEILKNLEDSHSKLEIINDYLIKEEKFKSEIRDNDNDKTRISDYEKTLTEKGTELKEAQKELADAIVQKESYKAKENEISAKFDGNINSLNTKIEKLRAQLLEAMKEAEGVQNKIAEHKRLIESSIKIKSDSDSKIGNLSGEIDNIKKETVDLKVMQDKYEKERLVLNRILIIEDIFGLEGIQTRIVTKYLPLLNIYIKECLDILSNGKIMVEIVINDKSLVDINISGGTADSFIMLSGGEKMLIRLATDIGLARLSFTRYAQKPEIVCLDEVFGPLDESNTQGVFRLLNKLQDDFGRVIVISHKPSINKMLKHQILIEKQPGINGLSEIRKVT